MPVLELTDEQFVVNLWCVQAAVNGYGGIIPDELRDLHEKLTAEVDSPDAETAEQ